MYTTHTCTLHIAYTYTHTLPELSPFFSSMGSCLKLFNKILACLVCVSFLAVRRADSRQWGEYKVSFWCEEVCLGSQFSDDDMLVLSSPANTHWMQMSCSSDRQSSLIKPTMNKYSWMDNYITTNTSNYKVHKTPTNLVLHVQAIVDVN